ncbi:MAG: EAL domain-containing protein, partial [Ilumatobacteraceae bacterium]
ARWAHAQRGSIHPGRFIPLSERSGIIDELGEWILERACADMLLMDDEGIDVELSVNMSVVQLRDPAVSQRIARLLTETGFPPGRLWIEVTESVLLDDKAILPLQVLHDMGVRLVVDDFGTGYATFQYITRLPVDALKIDTTFVSGLGIDARDTAIVRSVINLSRDLGLEVVAEGVETESQRSQLLALQCRFGQGWLLGRPVPFAEFVARYRSGAPVESAPPKAPAGDEATRLAVLKASRILDTDPELTFDSLVQLSAQLLSTPMAVISLVDADRQWFKASVGIKATEAPRDMFCALVLAEPLVTLVVADAPGDARFAESSLVAGPLNVHAYAGAPIRSREGLLLGVLSVLDIRPRDFTAEQIGQLQLLAEQVAALIDLRRSAAEIDDVNHRRRQPPDGADRAAELLQPINTDATNLGGVLIDLNRMSVERDTGAPGLVRVLQYGSLEIHLDTRTVTIDSQEVETTAKEFDLLAFLASRPGHVFSRDELLNHIWGSSKDWQDQATVTEHIYRLRKKIEPDRSKPRLLRTVRDRGYCFGPPTVEEISGVEAPAAAPRSGSWVHVDGRIVAADDGMVVLLAARSSDEIVGGHRLDYIAASSQPAAQARLEMRGSGHEPGTQVITMRAADGRELPVLMSTSIGEFDGAPAVIATVQEVLDPPQLIRQLVTGVTSEISEAVIVTDPLFHVVSWNAAAHRLYGWSEAEVLGHSLHDVIPSHQQQPDISNAEARQELLSTGRSNHEFHQIARDGSIVSVFASVNLIRDEQGVVAGIVAVNRPTSGRITLPDSSDELRATLQASSALADAAFDALVRLAALALSTPIASIAIVSGEGEGERLAASVGVAAGQPPGDAAFSAQATTEPDTVFVVADAAID